MKKVLLLTVLVAVAILAGCNEAQKQADNQLTLCQQEKQQLQMQVDKANNTIEQKDKRIADLQGQVREVNQKALESIQTMMQKQNEKDIELKNKLKQSEAQVKELQKVLEAMKAPVETEGGGM